MMTPLPKILLLEPQLVLRRTVASVTRQLGLAEIHEAADVDAASALLQAHRYDAALVDLDPAGKAAAWMGRLHAERMSLPLIVMHSQADGRLPDEAKLRGVQACLRKPIKARDLILALKSLVADPALRCADEVASPP
ncbi:response regulator [Azohydromonas aeria]|uniref:response regulator n=1 Tax=Azohydromonas aeria TaxID=2590212 RepID=UPI0012F857E8|nr:response regulator [Azohydromonas aeria]